MGVTLVVCFCFMTVSCKSKNSSEDKTEIAINTYQEKANSQYEKSIKEIDTHLEKLKSCTDIFEACKIQGEFLGTFIPYIQLNLFENLNEEERKILTKKIDNFKIMFLTKKQIIDQTSTLKIRPTKEEMRELTQKCTALSHGDSTQVDQIVKDFWKEKRGLN